MQSKMHGRRSHWTLLTLHTYIYTLYMYICTYVYHMYKMYGSRSLPISLSLPLSIYIYSCIHFIYYTYITLYIYLGGGILIMLYPWYLQPQTRSKTKNKHKGIYIYIYIPPYIYIYIYIYCYKGSHARLSIYTHATLFMCIYKTLCTSLNPHSITKIHVCIAWCSRARLHIQALRKGMQLYVDTQHVLYRY